MEETERATTTREYIKALLEYVKDDVRHDYLRVTGALLVRLHES
jgi:hypothetical protein